MSCNTFTEDPIKMAFVSALIGTLIALVGTKIYEKIKAISQRKQNLQNLKKLLEAHKSRFQEISDKVGSDQVHPHISVLPVYQFLHSEWIDGTKDSELINYLYNHLENLEQISRVFNIMDIRSGGFTSVQKEEGRNLENNLVSAIPIMMDNLENCINAIN